MTSPEGGTMKPCWIRFPEQFIGFDFSLARWPRPWVLLFGSILPSICRLRGPIGFGLVHQADPLLRLALARPFRLGFRPAPASLEIAATLAHRLVLATTFALVSPSRPRWFPEGTCTRSIRVSGWFRFGFPLPNRLPYKTDAVTDPESRKA
jgi:hypothetical protein